MVKGKKKKDVKNIMKTKTKNLNVRANICEHCVKPVLLRDGTPSKDKVHPGCEFAIYFNNLKKRWA